MILALRLLLGELSMTKPVIGIIGGTGLGEALARRGGEAISIDTPFGPPSAAPVRADWDGVEVVFLNRHGDGHRFNPTHVPYRANIFALKALGCTAVIASGATGSLREDVHPGELVVCDQVIDRTHRRAKSFFEDGMVAHVELADPFCARMRSVILSAAESLHVTVHDGGTYVCMEGPQFSTRAESRLHRSWGGDVIGMTCMPEAKLAREAEMCYALIALPTDYDCWRPVAPGADERTVLTEVLANLKRCTEQAVGLIQATVTRLGADGFDCPHCPNALKLAIWSDKNSVDRKSVERLRPLVGRYFSNGD